MPGGDVVLRVVAEKGASVGQVLADVEGGFGRLGSNVRGSMQHLDAFGERARGMSDSAAVAFAAVGASAAVMAKRFLDSASEMEQFRARLETVQHSAVQARETIAEMVSQAATSPFELKGLVEASVQLEALGQNSRTLMPLVVQAAAGMGRPVQETASAIGKAFSGSAEGFEIMRNQFGVSTFVLKKYGADVDSAGQLMVKTQSQLAHATAAVKTFLGTTFAGATERQMNTFSGALSNVGDAVGRLMTAFGSRLIPAFTSLAKTASSTLEVFERLPAPIKDFVAFGTVFVGVGGLMGAALLGLGTRALALVGTLSTMAEGYLAAGAASTVATTQMTGASAAASYMAASNAAINSGLVGTFVKVEQGAVAAATGGSALAIVMRQLAASAMAFVATPIGATLAAAGAIYLGAQAAFSSMDDANKKWGEQIEADAERIHNLGGAVRDFTAILQDLENKKKGIKPGEGVATEIPQDVSKWIQDSLKTANPAELAAAMQRRGITSMAELNKMLKAPEAGAKEVRERNFRLETAKANWVNQYTQAGVTMKPDTKLYLSTLKGMSYEEQTKLQKQLGADDGTTTWKELNQAITVSRREVSQMAVPVENFAKSSRDALGLWSNAADVIRNQQKGTKEYMTFLDKEGTSAAQQAKAKTLEAQSREIQGALQKVGLKTDSASIREYLKSDSYTPEQKEILGRILEIRGETKKTYEEARKLDAEEVQKKIDHLKQELAAKKALGQATVDDERRTQAAIAALRGEHGWNKEVGKKEVEDKKATFEEQISNSKNYLERLKSQNLLTHAQEAAGYQRILTSIQAFRKNVLPDLIKKDPAAAQALTTWAGNMEREAGVKQSEATKAARLQQITDLKHINDKFLEDQRARYQLSTERELEIVRQGRERMEKLGRGTYGDAGATPEAANESFMKRQAELQARARAIENDPKLTQDQKAKKLGDLADKKAQLAEYYTTIRGYLMDEASLQKRLHEEEIARIQERNNTRLSFLALELEDLKEQQANGKRVNDQVLANLNKQLALRLANIQTVAQKELEVQGLTQQQITDIHERANVQRLEALRSQRAALRQILEEQSGGLKDMQQKVGAIKQQAEEAKKGSPSALDTWGQDAFGAADRANQAKRDAQTTDQFLRKPGLDRSEMESLRSALERQGIILTSDETLGKQHARTPSGGTYATLEQLRKEYGVGTGDSTKRIADEISKLDQQIDDLEKAIADGLQTEVGKLGGGVDKLTQAVDRLSNTVAGNQMVSSNGQTRAQTDSQIPEVKDAWKKYSESMADIKRREEADKSSRGKDLSKEEKERYNKERSEAQGAYDKVLDKYGISDPSRAMNQAAQQHQQAAGQLSQAATDLTQAAGTMGRPGRAGGTPGGASQGGGAASAPGAAPGSTSPWAHESPWVTEQIRKRAAMSSPYYNPKTNTNNFPTPGFDWQREGAGSFDWQRDRPVVPMIPTGFSSPRYDQPAPAPSKPDRPQNHEELHGKATTEQPSVANVSMDVHFALGGDFGGSLDQTESELLRRAGMQLALNRVSGLAGD